jgi:hypothetical protein
MPLVGIGTLPTPFSPASVPLPPETGGRGHTSLRVGGWGESQFQRGAYTVVLFICTYFVLIAINEYKVNAGTNHSEGFLFIKNYHVSISYTQTSFKLSQNKILLLSKIFNEKQGNRATLKVYSKKEYT